MRPAPIVDGQPPPAQAQFFIGPLGESQGAADLGLAHQPGGAVATFDAGGVGNPITQLIQGLLNAFLCSVGVADFEFLQPGTLAMLDDLNVGRRARDAVADAVGSTAARLPGWPKGLPEVCREQAGVACITVREQGHLMPVRQTGGAVGQQPAQQRFIPPALDVGDDKLAVRIDQLSLPDRLCL